MRAGISRPQTRSHEILGCSPLKDRQVVVGDLEDDERHGRTVFIADAVGPEACGRLAAEQLVADGRVPLRPIVSAPQPHRLGGVVMTVVIVAVSVPELDLAGVFPEIRNAVADLFGVIFPAL